MIEKLISGLSWVAQIFAEWPARQAEKAQKEYANWRASVDLKKERRSRTAGDLVRSIDELHKKGKLSGK